MTPSVSLEDQIVAALRRIVRAVDLHSRSLNFEHGVTGPQVAVLRTLDRHGALASSVLARQVNLSPPTVTGIVSRLAERGLVTRTRSAADRRQVQVGITATGQRLLGRSPSLLQDRFLARLGAIEDWERSALLSSLQRLAWMMDADDLDAGPHLVSGSDLSADEAPASPGPSSPLSASEPADPSRLTPAPEQA